MELLLDVTVTSRSTAMATESNRPTATTSVTTSCYSPRASRHPGRRRGGRLSAADARRRGRVDRAHQVDPAVSWSSVPARARGIGGRTDCGCRRERDRGGRKHPVRILGEEVATVFARLHREHGVDLRLGTSLTEITTSAAEQRVCDWRTAPRSTPTPYWSQPDVELAQDAACTSTTASSSTPRYEAATPTSSRRVTQPTRSRSRRRQLRVRALGERAQSTR